MSLSSQIQTKVRNLVERIRRPTEVIEAQHAHLKTHPWCEACGVLGGGQAHHIKPYKKFPELGADPNNFITLCEHADGPECHLHVGHGGYFKTYNPDVVADAAEFKATSNDVARRLLLDRIRAKRQIDA